MEKKSAGRPKTANPLGRALAVRFTEAEEAEVRAAAAGAGAPLATYLREAALEKARQK